MASHNVPRPATTEQRTIQQLAQDKATIDKYRGVVEEIQSQIRHNQYTSSTLTLTSTLLSQNPEYYSIWNVRRHILISGISSTLPATSSPSKESHNTGKLNDPNPSSDVSSSSTANTSTVSSPTRQTLAHLRIGGNGTSILEMIERELSFVFPLLRAWPKCYWIWNHRIWLLKWANGVLEERVARRLWEGELKLVGLMLVKDNRNFHGWGYRRMVIEQLESKELEGKSMVEEEFAYTTSMFKANLSNFSAWHYRSVLIPRLLLERKADAQQRRAFLDSELSTIRDAYWTDPDDQSIWFYYQYLISDITNYRNTSNITADFTLDERITYIDRQLTDLSELLEDANDCKWIFNALIDMTTAKLDLQARRPGEGEATDLKSWLASLRNLDGFRAGRWNHVEEGLMERIGMT